MKGYPAISKKEKNIPKLKTRRQRPSKRKGRKRQRKRVRQFLKMSKVSSPDSKRVVLTLSAPQSRSGDLQSDSKPKDTEQQTPSADQDSKASASKADDKKEGKPEAPSATSSVEAVWQTLPRPEDATTSNQYKYIATQGPDGLISLMPVVPDEEEPEPDSLVFPGYSRPLKIYLVAFLNCWASQRKPAPTETYWEDLERLASHPKDANERESNTAEEDEQHISAKTDEEDEGGSEYLTAETSPILTYFDAHEQPIPSETSASSDVQLGGHESQSELEYEAEALLPTGKLTHHNPNLKQ